MYGDTGRIRHLASRLRERAEEIRGAADRLVGLLEAAVWSGAAGRAARAQAGERAAALRRTAGLHDDAADELLRHAREVEHLQDLIAELERRARGLMAAARERLADLGRRVLDRLPDPVDQVLARARTPPSGHRDWLTFELPGLR